MHAGPGRWQDARLPTALELNATTVVAVAIDSASAKVRTGPPNDDAEDYALLMGSVLVFALLTAVMVLTRRVDWFALTSRSS